MTIILDNGIPFSITKIEHFEQGEKIDEGFPEEHTRVWFQPCSVTGICNRGWYHVSPNTTPELNRILLNPGVSIRDKEIRILPNIAACINHPAYRGFFRYTGIKDRHNADLIPRKGE